MVKDEQKIINVKNIHLYVESFGDKDDPAVLLLMGNGCQNIFWPREFCQMMAQNGLYIVRFDYRDTGLSTHVDFQKNPYDLYDIIQDILGLMDNLNLDRAHIVGLSMGGFVAQLMALQYPEKVLSLTILMSTSDYRGLLGTFVNQGDGAALSQLPPIKDEFMKALKAIPEDLDPIETMVENWRAANGGKAPFDDAYWRALQKQAFDRHPDHHAGNNHRLAAAKTKEHNLLPLLDKLTIPTLVIQGSEDPIFPPEHALATAQTIPGAQCYIVQNMGHALNPHFFEEIATQIINHIKKAFR